MSLLWPATQPRLHWVQISVTTHCNASCTYCPRTVFRSTWQCRHIDPELFAQILSRLKTATLIHLQGWGEPILHPHFWDLLRMTKNAGFLASCTSNAELLDSDVLKKAVDSGLDVLALSLTGLDETNDRIRRGTSFRQVVKTIEELQRIKALRRSPVPRVHLAYMLLRSNLQELPRLPDFFQNLGLDHGVLSSLTLPLSPALEREALLAESEQEHGEFRAEMRRLFAEHHQQDKVFSHIFNPFRSPGRCSENVEKAFCLSPEGRVTPCVFTQIPAGPPVPYWFEGREYELEPADFGRLTETKLKKLWHDPAYRRFRRRLDLDMCSRCYMTRIEDPLRLESE